MNISRHHYPAPRALLAATATLLFGAYAHATDIEKADNTTALSLAGSYTAGGPPGVNDRILITNAMAANRSVALGGDLSIDGTGAGDFEESAIADTNFVLRPIENRP